MNVLFEDDGQLKAGAVLADNDATLQVEAVSGRRLKVKAGHVLLRFVAPGPGEAFAEGQRLAADLDPTFLWEVSADDEFGFADLAREYFGGVPTPAQAAAVALTLHASPMHFYKKGKGRYRKAPPDALRAALASVERKAREAEQIAAWTAELAAGRLPGALAAKLPMLLYKPDKNALEWKALAAACDAGRTNPVELLAACGAIPSSHEYHFNRFLAEAFPNGVACGEWGALPTLPELPVAPAPAFSIDDATTTEIDDAFSVRELANGHYEVGIHIACPALSLPRGGALDRVARARLSTVYMPGRKITMLPEAAIAAFTLHEGAAPPALSLLVEVTPDGTPVRHETRVQRVPIAANLRLDTVGNAFANDLPSPADPPWTQELRVLWKLARHLSAQRGKDDIQRIDYSFYVDWDAAPDGRVAIVPRERGSPLDKLVSELMIHVNSTWGRLLADRKVAGLYRVQAAGKVKMSTRPGEHQGLGLTHYLWASSPLRRYSDLVNQRQLLAAVAGEAPPYADNDADLFAALADFEATYSQYAEFQERMEHYWCLRWLLQENVTETTARVIRENLVRCERLPLVLRVPDLPVQAPDTVVRLALARIDLLAATFECRFAGLQGGNTNAA
ncbi:MAG: RNB domain-containing ribonuclease [Betaproteobacteria bacterium]|nr:RNB domain-containing ribonuclease [Betaproteobacteria bacterium]MCC7216453.1 RNB domain-containing ribonuclease [Burkholderiales bacterium]